MDIQICRWFKAFSLYRGSAWLKIVLLFLYRRNKWLKAFKNITEKFYISSKHNVWPRWTLPLKALPWVLYEHEVYGQDANKVIYCVLHGQIKGFNSSVCYVKLVVIELWLSIYRMLEYIALMQLRLVLYLPLNSHFIRAVYSIQIGGSALSNTH